MIAYLRLELKTFFTNKKNIAVYVLLLCFALFYAIKLAPAYDPIEKVDIEEMEARYLTREEFLISREGKDPYGAHPAVIYAQEAFKPWNELDLQRMQALMAKDLQTYAKVTSEWYRYTDMHTAGGGYFYYNPRYYTYGNTYAHFEGHMANLEEAALYEQYAKFDKDDLSLEVLEQFTAIQTIQRLLDDYLHYVLLIGALLLSVDIILQDRKYPTLLRGYPIADWKKLLVKALTAFIGSIALLVPIFIGYVIIGVQFGFGSFKLPVAVYNPTLGYETITMTTYFMKTGALLAGWILVIISLVILLSMLIRSELFNLVAGLLLILSENFYLDRGYGFFKPVEKYLPTYTHVGDVVTNLKNYFYESSTIVFSTGIILLLVTAFSIFAIALLASLSKHYKMIK